jgi:hypothetical protein
VKDCNINIREAVDKLKKLIRGGEEGKVEK